MLTLFSLRFRPLFFSHEELPVYLPVTHPMTIAPYTVAPSDFTGAPSNFQSFLTCREGWCWLGVVTIVWESAPTWFVQCPPNPPSMSRPIPKGFSERAANSMKWRSKSICFLVSQILTTELYSLPPIPIVFQQRLVQKVIFPNICIIWESVLKQ